MTVPLFRQKIESLLKTEEVKNELKMAYDEAFELAGAELASFQLLRLAAKQAESKPDQYPKLVEVTALVVMEKDLFNLCNRSGDFSKKNGLTRKRPSSAATTRRQKTARLGLQ